MAKHSHPKGVKSTGATAPKKKADSTPSTSADATPHAMVVAIATLLAFGFGAVMVAGIGPKSGKLVVGILVLMTVVQVLTHVNPLVEWSADHPLIPGQQTLTVGGSSK